MNAPGSASEAQLPRTARNEDEPLPALAWMRRAQAEDELLREVERQVRRRRMWRWFAATAGAAIVVGVGLLWRTLPVGSTPTVTTITTATLVHPTQRRLPDGSVVDLRNDADLAVDFAGTLRRVCLRQGEAFFTVAKDPQRAFVVEVGGVNVRAVGTAFGVQLAARRVEVVVAEGQVAVSSSSLPPERSLASAAPALIEAGQRCVISQEAGPQVASLPAAELSERLSWRIAQLEFSRTPLPEIVGLMNRHNPRRVHFVIGDAALNSLRLSGYLRADNDQGLVQLLETHFAVRAVESHGTVTLLPATTPP